MRYRCGRSRIQAVLRAQACQCGGSFTKATLSVKRHIIYPGMEHFFICCQACGNVWDFPLSWEDYPFEDHGEISIDEVLNLHEALKALRVPFSTLFADSSKR